MTSVSSDIPARDNITLFLQRAAESVADAVSADHVLLLCLDKTNAENRYQATIGWNPPIPESMEKYLDAASDGEMPAGLANITVAQGHLPCTAYIPTPAILQIHGLHAGLLVTMESKDTRLTMYAGRRSGTGAACGEPEARIACAILTMVDISVRQLAELHPPAVNMQRVIKAKHQCESIMDALPELIVLLDVHGNVIRVNLTLEMWHLGKVDTIQGVNIHDMLHPDCGDWGCRLRTLCELMWRQLDGFNPMHYEIRDHRLDRDLRFSICRYSRPRHVNDADKEGYASLIIEDVSQQKHTEQVLNNYNEELEKRLQERTLDLTRANALLKGKIDEHIRDAAALRESEKKYTCLVETTLTGLYVIQDKKLVFCNGRFAEIFDYPHEEIYGLELTQLFPDDDTEAITGASDLRWNTASTFDKQVVRGTTRRGDTVWLQRSLTRVDCMGGSMVLGNVIDITEQKLVEEALRGSQRGLKMLSEKLIYAQEEERKRIASELHDSVGQSISAVKFSVENALREFEQQSPQAGGKYLHHAILKLRDTMDEVRRISMDLRPSMLDDLGLLATINWFCRDIQALSPDVVLNKQIDIEEDEIPACRKIVIFRILQEALHNIGKHAQARTVSVILTKTDGALVLRIEDDGRGFDAETLSDTHGFGLNSMRERAKLSGGRFTVISTPGKGTAVRVAWHPEECGAVTD